MTGSYHPIEMDTNGWVSAMTFSASGEYIASGHNEDVRIWRVRDGKQTTTMRTGPVGSFAVSRDGKWIAAGTGNGLWVWNAKTYEIAFKKDLGYTYAVDFSPDATHIVSGTGVGIFVWDVASGKRIQPRAFGDDDIVSTAKYSPRGDRIATATYNSIQVWDSNDGRLLVDIKVKATPLHNNGFVWLNNHLLVVSEATIHQFDAITGSIVTQWSVPASDMYSCIVLHRNFIAYMTKTTVTFWDKLTHSQLGLIQYPQNIRFISFSPDDQSLAICGQQGKITVLHMSRIGATGSGLESLIFLHSTFQEPDIQIGATVLESWQHDRLDNAEVLLTVAISESQNPSHHLFSSRALVRTRLGNWIAALEDAEKAIDIHPSIFGFIAKSIAHVGKGERHKAYRACDIAFERFHSTHVTSLLLIKAIIVFMAGEHSDAISRVDDLIATVPFGSTCYTVQAYMYLLLGNSQMESHEYDHALRSFECARARIRDDVGPPLFAISLMSGWKFDNLDITIRQRLCEALDATDRTVDAAKCFNELEAGSGENNDQTEWARAFGRRFSAKLERLGDNAMDALQHYEAISYYTTALSLVSFPSHAILKKRSKAWLATGSWKEALDDANEAIVLDPSSPWGYEIKHAALYKGGDYDNATDTLEVMLSKMAESCDPDVQRQGDQYISPSSTRATIRKIVQRTVRNLPRVLINTVTGRLYNAAEQTAGFESLPVFEELVASMTTRVDYVRIKHEVQKYFRYVMLSHRWEDNEPLYHHVMRTAVYHLEQSPTHDKLQMFCKIVRDAGFHWAWSDTCCINKSDHFVLQEALVAMFKWYQGAAMMIVFLRGVRSSPLHGALAGSLWNTRAWTLQEYIAAKVIRFYTEDWTPYQNLQTPNHKESPEVIAEMEEATGISAEQLTSLRPGLTSIREKLCLASTRETTLVEDAAYSLLGIFSVTGVPAIYGEGEGSLGRLLAHIILTGSGDVSILAWTGESGGFNSCLPAHISVFNSPATSYLPSPISHVEMERHINAPHSTSFDLDLALRLYDRLNELSLPWFAASRMKLPCIAFQLPPLNQTRSSRVYRVETDAFGVIEIKTRRDLSRMKTLYLVHPWLETILDREDIHGGAYMEDVAAPSLIPVADDEEIDDKDNDDAALSFSEPGSPSHSQASVCTAPLNKETRARQLVARLRQPFGALLLTLASTGRRTMDYKRVATDSLITVQIQESVSLSDVLDNVRILDVL